MPISADEWDKGRTFTTWESTVEQFLSANKGQAFSLSEITTKVGSTKSTGNTALDFLGALGESFSIRNALANLVKEGTVKAKIVKKEIGEETYYTIAR